MPSIALAEGLRAAGYDAVHVRDYGIQTKEDEVVFERVARENRVVVSGDTDFGTLIAVRQDDKPSVILLRRTSQRRPAEQLALPLANLPNLTDLLDHGSVVVLEDARIRSRLLPIGRAEDPE